MTMNFVSKKSVRSKRTNQTIKDYSGGWKPPVKEKEIDLKKLVSKIENMLNEK